MLNKRLSDLLFNLLAAANSGLFDSEWRANRPYLDSLNLILTNLAALCLR